MTIPALRVKQIGRVFSEKSHRYVEAWYQVHTDAAGRCGDIGEVEGTQIDFLIGVIIT